MTEQERAELWCTQQEAGRAALLARAALLRAPTATYTAFVARWEPLILALRERGRRDEETCDG